MSRLVSLAAVAGLLMVASSHVDATGGGGVGGAGAAAVAGGAGRLAGNVGGVPVWQTPENEPGAQARRERQTAPAAVTGSSVGARRHHRRHRHHTV
jgi:hypothetical protein